tara:strand:- start:161 stop:2224 length:2064 start_codon:yes stop_codon:yes gene_type:complete
MVLSKIDQNINYLESNNLDKNDQGESYAYRAKIFGKKVKFALGKPNFQYIDNNIVYFNIYLVKNSELVAKIGIFETKNTSYRELLDIEGNIVIEKLDYPLFFSYAKPYILSKYNFEEDDIEFTKKADSEDEDNDEDEDEDEDEGESDEATSEDSEISSDDQVEDVKEFEDKPIILKEQTKEESDFEIQNFKSNDSDKWINKFLKSHKYSIIDNEGGGDCFYAVLRDALKTLNLEKYSTISVKNIRKKLADDLDETQYNTYKEFYDFYKGGLKKTQEKITELKKIHKRFKVMIGGTSNTNDKSVMLKEAKSNLQKVVDSNEESKEYQELTEEFEFMKDVKTIDDLKNVIKNNIFWADSWAISALERLYNVKFVILAEENFDETQEVNPEVLQCGESDKHLQKKDIFQPDYYIICNYQIGSHYKLITYDKNIGKGAFKFSELPYKLKQEIVDICMKSESSLFYKIPDFRDFATKQNVKIQKTSKFESLVDKPKSQLYDDTMVIQIYSKSLHKKVGEGSGENITKEQKTLPSVLKLFKIKDWRRKLDNSYLLNQDNEKLEIKGNLWPSIHHYLYAVRFSNLPDIYNKFTLSNEETSSSELTKAFYDKMITTYKSKIMSDADYKKDYSKFLTEALNAKFNLKKDGSKIFNQELNDILLLTGNSKINIYKPGRGGGVYEATELMKIREVLAK